MNEQAAEYSLWNTIQDLGIPTEGLDMNQEPGEQVVHLAARFVDKEMAKSMWRKWNPKRSEELENHEFVSELQQLLSQVVKSGFSIDRLEETSHSLGESMIHDPEFLISYFEEIVNETSLNVYLNREDYKDWIEDQEDGQENTFQDNIKLMTQGLYYELGLNFPEINFIRDEALNYPFFRIEWNDVKIPAEKGMDNGMVLVNDTVDHLKPLNVYGEKTKNPANNLECSFVPKHYKKAVEDAGLTTWTSDGYFILSLSTKIRKNAASFVNRAFVDFLLFQLKDIFPETVKEFNKTSNRNMLTGIIRALLDEEISVKNLNAILEFMLMTRSSIHADHSKDIVFNVSSSAMIYDRENDKELTLVKYVEQIRSLFKRNISHKYTRGGNYLKVFLVDPSCEKRLMQSPELTPRERELLTSSIAEKVEEYAETAQYVTMLTTVDIRRRLREEIRVEFPNIPVLSYQELENDVNIQPLARISPEIFPFDESYMGLMGLPERFFETLPSTDFDIDKRLSLSKKKLVSLLSDGQKDLIETIITRVNKTSRNQLFPMLQVRMLAGSFIHVFRQTLGSGKSEYLDALLAGLKNHLHRNNMKCLSEIVLILHECIVEHCENDFNPKSVKTFSKAVEEIEKVRDLIINDLINTMFDQHPKPTVE